MNVLEILFQLKAKTKYLRILKTYFSYSIQQRFTEDEMTILTLAWVSCSSSMLDFGASYLKHNFEGTNKSILL